MRLFHLVTSLIPKSIKGYLFTLVITALGFPFVLPPITLVYYLSKLTWKPMSFPLNSVTNKLPVRACSESGNQSVSLNTNPSQSDRPRKRKGGEEDEGPKYPKRGRPASYHPDKPDCDPCAIWQQSGADPNLRQFHSQRYKRHAGHDSSAIAAYAYHDNVSFDLTYDSCICLLCSKDFIQNRSNKENTVPYWALKYYSKVRQQCNQHCLFCCTQTEDNSACQCSGISHWGPETWHGQDDPKSWKKYLCVTGLVDPTVACNANHICRTHNRQIPKIKESKECEVCTTKGGGDCWKLVGETSVSPEAMCTLFSLPAGTVSILGCVCIRCRLCSTDAEKLRKRIEDDANSNDSPISTRARLIRGAINKIQTEGIIFTKDVVQEYRQYLAAQADINMQRLLNTFTKYMDTILKKYSFTIYAPQNTSGKYGRVIYNDKVFNPKSIPYVFKLKLQQWTLEAEVDDLRAIGSATVNTSKLRSLIKEQAAMFPDSHDFDYRTLAGADGGISEHILDTYFNPQLFDLLQEATASEHSLSHAGHQYQPLYIDRRRHRVRMVIALFCNPMIPSCFFQTLVGLICYAYGLRDKGFELLNMLGCTCSIDLIRKHGSFWANKRNAVDELDCKQPWRVSIDNLNFNIKFAKNLTAQDGRPKKMLNLLTGQVHVTTRKTVVDSIFSKTTLGTLIHHSFAASIHSEIHTRTICEITENEFLLDLHKSENFYYNMCRESCFVSTAQRLSTPPMECKESFIYSSQAFMPHWTPTAQDNVVYATIKEAMSGSETDVEMYLYSLKRELHIGQDGHPSHVTLAGDQQMYAIMKKLKRKHPGHLAWVSIIPGDWHLMKLTAEVLRDLLWDGGLKEFAYECGYKKQPTQWQEINLLLIATYIALLRKAACVYSSTIQKEISSLKFYPNSFLTWLDLVRSTTNEDQVSRFWAEALFHLNSYVGYYFSIRSGNWLLRNSCLKAILPLFFAYCRNKYEELSTTSVLDTFTFPQTVLILSLNGQWTVSQKGRPYHNIAIDEAHECLINLHLKLLQQGHLIFAQSNWQTSCHTSTAYLILLRILFQDIENYHKINRSI